MNFMSGQTAKLGLCVLLSGLLIACDGNTELMKAAMSGDPATVRDMVDKGAVVDELNNYGWTALAHAARQNETASIAVLLDAGANINNQDKDIPYHLLPTAIKIYPEKIS